MITEGLESIEFLDYIFDRYAFLGIEQTAAEEEVRKVIRDRKVLNHPDRFEFAEDKIKAEAKRNWDAIIKCEAVLLDPELRPIYNERLSQFQEQNPHLVSKDGIEILNLANPRHQVNVQYLLSGETFDISEIIKKAVALSGHTPEKLARAKRFYERDTEDRDSRDMYHDALEKALAYHGAIEDWLWAVAGVLGKNKKDDEAPLFDISLLQNKVAGQIAHVRDTLIPQQVEQREALQALGYDKKAVLLLTHAGKEITSPADKEATNEIIGKVQSRFDALSEAIKENAAERAKAIETILSLSGFSLLHKAERTNAIVHLLGPLKAGQDPDDAVVLLSMTSVETEESYMKHDTTKAFQNIPYGKLKEGPFDRTTAAIFYDATVREPSLSLGYAFKMIGRAFGLQYTLDVNVTKTAPEETIDDESQSASRPIGHANPNAAAEENLG